MKNKVFIPTLKSPKKAFTLIEILVVIAIIGVLVAASSKVVEVVAKKQMSSRAVADITVFKTSLESFKGMYNDYPRLNFGSDGDLATRRLFRCMVGLMFMRIEKDSIVFVDIPRVEDARPFVDVSSMRYGDPNDPYKEMSHVDPDVCFLDPWDNPYYYYYDSSSTIGTTSAWDTPFYILMTNGPDGKDTQIGSMFSTGILPNIDTYQDAPFNADNIVYPLTN